MFAELQGLNVTTNRKILNSNSVGVVMCSNKTLLIISATSRKRTGEVTDVSIDEKQSNTLIITYEKKVRKPGVGPKQIKFTFQNSQDMDIFMAAYNRSITMSTDTSNIVRNGDRAQIKLWVGTFNMGNKAPKDEFKKFLRDAAAKNPDIMFYAAQEADYGNGSADQLFDLITKTLQPEFVCLIKRSFGEMRLVILINQKFESWASNITASTEATGILGLMNNKGGIITCLNILGSPIAFVSSHLNAHQGNVQRRNEDFKAICTCMSSIPPPFDLCSGFHHIIWAGDLNYRIEQTYDQVVAATEKKDWDSMWPSDQLNQQMMLKKTFNGFTEGKIAFAPTYKFKKGTKTYDAESTRIPAWCDRVLIRSFEGLEKTCVEYLHIDSVTTSDHHPVSALWKLDVVMPSPPPPPFASVIGVIPYIEISNLQIETGQPIESVSAEFIWPFSVKVTTATGKGKKYVLFPDDTVPLLVPDSYVSMPYLKTEYISMVFTINQETAIAILPLSIALPDVPRQFSIKAEYKLKEIGKVTGCIKLVSASRAHINEQQLRHQKAQLSHQFQTL